MNRWRKAISVGLTTALVGSLLATAGAPAALAALGSTFAGNITPGGASSAAFTLSFAEDSVNDFGDGSFTVAVLSSAGADAHITWDTSSVPSVTRNLGVGGATVGFSSDTLVVSVTGTDVSKIDAFTVGNLKVKATAGAAQGAVIFNVVADTVGLPDILVPASGTTTSQITAPDSTSFTYALVGGSPHFQVTGSACDSDVPLAAGSVTVAASGLVGAEAFSSVVPTGGGTVTKATAFTGDKPIGTGVTQSVCATRFPSVATVGGGVGAATKLGFTAQPGASLVSQTFPVQPVVVIQDASGNRVTTGPSSTLTVTLATGANPGGAVLTCVGGLTKVAVAGLATFSGCSLNRSGTGFTLVASAPGLTSATTSPFNVTAPAATITLTNSASVITWGDGIVLNVQFGANGANRAFVLEGARDGVTFTTIANLTTNAGGLATFPYTPVSNLFYRARFTGTTDLAAANSNTIRTVVRQIALLRPTNAGAVRTIFRNASIVFTTSVRPARPDLVPARVSFVLYQRVGGVWALVTTRNVFINSLGVATTTFKFTSAGSWYVRSIANPTPFNANSVWSPVERYIVR